MASQIVTQHTSQQHSAANGRTWADAELWCRDAFAQASYRRTFNALTLEQQNVVLQIVQRVVTDAQFYLAGIPEPMNEYTRAQVQPGATATQIDDQTSLAPWFDTFTRRSQRVQ
jgi:O-phosphoseryl-tRNA(Cys) synthetase